MTAHKARTCPGQGQPLRFGDRKGAGPETGSAKWAVTIKGGQVPSPPLVITVTIRAVPDPSETALTGKQICGDPYEDITVHLGNRGITHVYDAQTETFRRVGTPEKGNADPKGKPQLKQRSNFGQGPRRWGTELLGPTPEGDRWEISLTEERSDIDDGTKKVADPGTQSATSQQGVRWVSIRAAPALLRWVPGKTVKTKKEVPDFKLLHHNPTHWV